MDYKEKIAQALANAADMPAEQIEPMIEVPTDSAMGDYAFPCFRLAKEFRKAPPMIAAGIAEKLELPECVKEAKVVGAYINFYLDNARIIRDVLVDVTEKGEAFGSVDIGHGRNVCIDYSSINIAKPFHIGHLSTTVIGSSLYKIYKFLGYNPIGINHLGDWGTQFGKLITAYKMWGRRQDIEDNSISAMLALYVRFHDEAEKDESLNDTAREWFKKIEDGDAEALEIFNWFKEVTLKEVKVIYDMLGVEFDSYDGESFYNNKMQPIIDELRDKDMLEESDGAYVVRLGEEIPPCIILKTDGATLYSTRDLAAAFYRKKTYDFYKCLYVVAYQQDLHFKQWFKVVELMGYEWAKDLEHVSFGMVSLEGATLSTRKGNVVFLQDVLEKAVEKTRAIIDEKSPDLQNKDDVAKVVGVGAVVFDALSTARIKDSTFSFERVLNFDGETGPYVQYTHARCKSLLRRADFDYKNHEKDYSAIDNKEAFAIAKLLLGFGETVQRACEKSEPYLVTKHIIEIAKAMNRFYFEHRIISDDKAATAARLMVADCVSGVIKMGLGLLGVGAPERM
ncbi:MAG: arginine--tRNA ligase [Clostridia bacterium]|jgi:arginyl-tRNA synthetase|nr:arginine--tRNA ligase [Clostridia bacterium]MBT7123357.1 arginine--tRNA ligase [Clostridia bacterium]